MDFHLACSCGEHVTVADGAAGTLVECSCGRMVAVPTLGELRTSVGLHACPSASLVIENMIAHGELPTSETCACCRKHTIDAVRVTAECEKIWQGESTPWAVYLFFGLWGLIAAVAASARREETVFGRNLVLHLPLRIEVFSEGVF